MLIISEISAERARTKPFLRMFERPLAPALSGTTFRLKQMIYKRTACLERHQVIAPHSEIMTQEAVGRQQVSSGSSGLV